MPSFFVANTCDNPIEGRALVARTCAHIYANVSADRLKPAVCSERMPALMLLDTLFCGTAVLER